MRIGTYNSEPHKIEPVSSATPSLPNLSAIEKAAPRELSDGTIVLTPRLHSKGIHLGNGSALKKATEDFKERMLDL